MANLILQRINKHFFRNSKTKDLCFKSDMIKLSPLTIIRLDKIGMSHLEIMTLAGVVGKRIDTLPTADIDFLNMLEDKYQVVFNLEDKHNNKKSIKLNSISGDFMNATDKAYPRFSTMLIAA